jgi:hypothetical protein
MSRKQDAYWQRAQLGRLLPEPRAGNKAPVVGHRRLNAEALRRLWMRERHASVA